MLLPTNSDQLLLLTQSNVAKQPMYVTTQDVDC